MRELATEFPGESSKGIWSQVRSKRDKRRFYVSLLPAIRQIARRSGYAIGIHGSLSRDLDLIAVPWTRKHVKPATLVKRISALSAYPAAMRFHYEAIAKVATRKPCGRLAFAIYFGPNVYADLSVFDAPQGKVRVR
jgi:hypothetical protein